MTRAGQGALAADDQEAGSLQVFASGVEVWKVKLSPTPVLKVPPITASPPNPQEGCNSCSTVC